MKISQTPDNPVAISNNAASLAAKNGSAASTIARTSAVKSTPSAGVAVTVSNATRSLKADGTGAPPDIDMAKVSAMRSAIANGTFKVNPEAIADKMLSNAGEMLQRSRV
ncbi:MAG: flagellar biosynthesis anti-sigma factor FlgM [Rhodoferax sp.]